jgi:Icc protein
MGPIVTSRTAEYPRPDHFLLHISDTHVLAGGGKLYDRVESERHLQTLFEEFEASGGRPEAIVFTGDMADKGEPDAYDRIRGIVDPVAERLGAQVIWVMGNHDERAPFAEILLGEPDHDEPVNRVIELDGLRIITLDSSVPGYHHGVLERSTLEWLDEALAEPSEHGTVVALHHAPIATPLALMDILELRGQDEFADVIRDRDVRAVLGGHLHYPTQGEFAGIPVFVAGSLAYTMDLSAPPRELVGIDGGHSVSLVHLFDDGVVNSVVPVGAFREITSFGEQFLTEIEGLDEAGRLERFSRKRETTY